MATSIRNFILGVYPEPARPQDKLKKMRVRVVLVEPHEAGNVGAAARAMRNFGFHDLAIVGSRPQVTRDAAEWWAKGGAEVVQSARHFETLKDALADVHLSIATTAVHGRHVFEQLAPRDVAQLAEETLGDGHTLALVFGREEWGLSSAEIAMCQRTASVPTAPDSPTMNLALAVAVFCYELAKGLRPRAKAPDPAPGDLIEHLNARTRQLLIDIGFFADKAPDRLCAELQALAGKRTLSTREASLLLSFVAHVERAIRQPQ
jgi:tRNA/rRNA methyltransferase